MPSHIEQFIEYADGLRYVVDQEFACGKAERDASQREFDMYADGVRDDALLASVMRKILSSEDGWVDYAGRDVRWPGPAWLTIDVRRVELTDEEYAAVERAGE